MKKIIITSAFIISLFTYQNVTGQGYTYEDENIKNAAEKILEMAGGRYVWENVRTIRLLAVNHFPGVELGTLFEVWIDFEEPHTLTRLLNHNFNRLRGFLGNSGWSYKENGEVTAYTKERLMQEKVLWEGAFTRNIWRIAKNDKNLFLKWGKNGRMEFHNIDGGMTAWFILNSDGIPELFGFPGFDKGLELDEFKSFGKRKIPAVGMTPEGVKFESIYLRVSDEPLNVPKTAPKDLQKYNPRFFF